MCGREAMASSEPHCLRSDCDKTETVPYKKCCQFEYFFVLFYVSTGKRQIRLNCISFLKSIGCKLCLFKMCWMSCVGGDASVGTDIQQTSYCRHAPPRPGWSRMGQ